MKVKSISSYLTLSSVVWGIWFGGARCVAEVFFQTLMRLELGNSRATKGVVLQFALVNPNL